VTPARFLLILGVIVLVLFGVSLAVQNKTQGDLTNPTNSWASRVNAWWSSNQKLDARKEVDPAPSEGKWLTPAINPRLILEIKRSEDEQTIRKATFGLRPGHFQITYTPRPDEKDAAKLADPQAVRLDIQKYDPVRGPLTLVFLKHGGKLDIRRTSGLGPMQVDLK